MSSTRYYSFPGESTFGTGTVFIEVDLDNDYVARSVQKYGDIWLFGTFDGTKESGDIADGRASDLQLKQEEEISWEMFERMWSHSKKTGSDPFQGPQKIP